MKEILTQLAEYNVWANQRLSEVVKSLNEEQQQQNVLSSFPSLKETLQHIWDAESMWWQRLQLAEQVLKPSLQSLYSTIEIIDHLSKQDKQWVDWITAASEAAITHVFAYQNTKKEQFKQPVYEMLFHVFNHSTYHRGQLVTMFHQLEITKIPATDFIEFCRRK